MTTSTSDNFQRATIQIPTGAPNGEKRRVPCRFRGMESKRLTVQAQEDVAPGTPISIECDDSLFLGEVITCCKLGGESKMEVRVEQVLSGLQSLMALRSRLLDECRERVPSALQMMPAGVYN